MALEALSAAIDDLVSAEPDALADPASIVELHRQLDRLEAVATRATGAFDVAGGWRPDGARSPASWLLLRCRRPRSAAGREVGLARSLRHLPECETAWLAGEIGSAHVHLLATVLRTATEARLALDEEMLVGHATTLPFSHFAKVVAYWAQHADPDGADRTAEDQRAARRWHLSQSLGGIWFANGAFDPLSGQAVADELERIEAALFDADWAEARLRLGHDPTMADLGRAPAQRRADALVEMARRSRTAPEGGRRPEPLFTVLIGWETLRGRICELANGTVVAPGALIPWLDTAWLERVVFAGPSRILDVGVAQRLFTGATRRAVEVRDQECYHPYCDAPASGCQVDHIIPHAVGGPTTQANGRLACGFHNRARHQRPP